MRAVSVAAAVAVLLSAQAARAQETDPLADGLELFERLHMMEARDAFERALRVEGRTPSELADIYLRLGIIAAADGDLDAAERSFLRLLAVDSEARLPPGMSPSVAAAFERARTVWDAAELNLAEVEPPALGEDDRVGVTLAGREDRASMVLALRLFWRPRGEEAYRTATALGLGPHRFTLGGVGPGAVVEYHAALLGDHQAVLARLGTPVSPRRATVLREPAPLAWYERWYVWAGAGVVAVGATIAILVLLSPEAESYDARPRVE